MISAIRELLRRRRAARQISRDDARDRLLDTPEGGGEYWSLLADECAESSLISLLEEALKVEGNIVECGVFRGASLRRIARTVKDIAPERLIFGLDSFEGFPPEGITSFDLSGFRSKSRLSGKFTNAVDVPERLSKFAKTFDIKLELRKGYFEDTLSGLKDQSLCFIHIDCDTYSGHVEVLEALYPNLTPGGVIVFDDYGSEAWPGATQAVDEFFASRNVVVQQSFERKMPAWYLVKPA